MRNHKPSNRNFTSPAHSLSLQNSKSGSNGHPNDPISNTIGPAETQSKQPQRQLLLQPALKGDPRRAALIGRTTGTVADGLANLDFLWRNRFIKSKGARDTLLRGRLAAEERRLSGLKAEHAKVSTKLDRVPESADFAPVRHPPVLNKPLRCLVLFLVGVLAFILIVSWLNTAGFAIAETQSWVRALFYCSLVFVMPIGFKFAIDNTRGRLRQMVWGALAVVGVAACLVFIGSFAQRFAYEPAGDDLANLVRANDMRWQLGSQILGEVALGTILFLTLQKLTGIFPFRRRFDLEDRQASLGRSIFRGERRIAKLRAKLDCFTAGLEAAVIAKQIARDRKIMLCLLKA